MLLRQTFCLLFVLSKLITRGQFCAIVTAVVPNLYWPMAP